MKYLCLVYIEEKKLDALSKSELDALIAESLAYDEVLRKSGHLIVAQALFTSSRPRLAMNLRYLRSTTRRLGMLCC
jgi:hypothetical protein